ncbi:MAG: H+transporting two-sector ATPase delta/epsilon subunit, partial [Candidatus Kaiserbacteria bacterium GW2011_GWC2_52_8b]
MAEQQTFHLVIASVGETRFDGDVYSATVPGSEGQFTVLAHHEPIVTTLTSGIITVKTKDGEKKFSIDNGVVECSQN